MSGPISSSLPSSDCNPSTSSCAAQPAWGTSAPHGDFTTVQPGETGFDDVARRAGVNATALRLLNPHLKSAQVLPVGTVLELPMCTMKESSPAGAPLQSPSAPGLPAAHPFAINLALPNTSLPPHVVALAGDDSKACNIAKRFAQVNEVPIVKLAPGSMSGVKEVSLVAHGNPNVLNINGKLMTPEAAAQEMVKAGWDGGTVRLVACHGDVVSTVSNSSVAQRMANEFARLGAESGVIGGQAKVGSSPKLHGGQSIVLISDAQGKTIGTADPGKGWGYRVAEPGVPTGAPVAMTRPPQVPKIMITGATLAGRLTNVLGAVGMLKLAWDWAKMMELQDDLEDGLVDRMWEPLRSQPSGAQIQLEDGKTGVLSRYPSGNMSIKWSDGTEWQESKQRDGSSSLLIIRGNTIESFGRSGYSPPGEMI